MKWWGAEKKRRRLKKERSAWLRAVEARAAPPKRQRTLGELGGAGGGSLDGARKRPERKPPDDADPGSRGKRGRGEEDGGVMYQIAARCGEEEEEKHEEGIT